MEHPRVGIIMGSVSDLDTMRAAASMLDELAVRHEMRVVSAHRTPDLLFDYASTAAARGLRVIIAGAGGAAHLPGMTAAKTQLPVIGVPVRSATLDGLDSLLSIAQMPAGVPVATMAIAGAANAALYAARILALSDVRCVIADEGSGAPEIAWGDRFFLLGSDRLPFATIVEHDKQGFDEDSRVDRPGVFRLNVELGREEFAHEFGYTPAEFEERRSGIDFAALDELVPHPVYGTQGWACILNPSVERLPDVDRLLAHRRALNRQRSARR